MTMTLDTHGLGLAFRRLSSIVLFGALPAALILLLMSWTVGTANFLSDFRGDLYNAGSAIIAGHDPYRAGFLARLAALARAGGHPSNIFAVPVYPAPALLAAVPLSLLAYQAAGLLFTILSIAALCAGLWLLDVRDWRCYGAAFLSWPMLHSIRLGQVNELLVLGGALAWRWRARAWLTAAAVAAVVVAKLLLWPLGVFLLLTRRWRAAVLAVAIGAGLTIAAWAVLGFNGLSAYPRMLSDLSAVEGTAGISFASLAAALGLPRVTADLAAVLVTGTILVLAWVCLKRPDGERRAFGLAVVAGLTSSSLVWPHYLVLLYIPIALIAPTLGPLWLLPLLGYLAPVELTHHDVWNIIPYVVIEAVVVGALCAPPRGRRAEGPPPSRPESPLSRRFVNPLGGRGTTVRLMHGLGSTSPRSHPAAQRPSNGPSAPY
jgi:hypothetical protein